MSPYVLQEFDMYGQDLVDTIAELLGKFACDHQTSTTSPSYSSSSTSSGTGTGPPVAMPAANHNTVIIAASVAAGVILLAGMLGGVWYARSRATPDAYTRHTPTTPHISEREAQILDDEEAYL